MGEEESETEMPCKRNIVTGGDSAGRKVFKVYDSGRRVHTKTLNLNSIHKNVFVWHLIFKEISTLRDVSEKLSIIPVPLEAVEGITLQPIVALQAQ